jgi:hypothetical protein
MTEYADGVLRLSSVHNLPGVPRKQYTESQIQDAMTRAVQEALDEGISISSPEIRKRMKAARRGVTHAAIK